MANRFRLFVGTFVTAQALVSLPAQALPQYSVFDLGALTGPATDALQINDVGQVLVRGGGSSTFLYTPGSGVADLAQLTGLAAGSPIAGYGLNNLGQVIGQSGRRDRSFIYRPGQPTEYLPARYTAYTLNDAGQYVGTRSSGASGFFRYTPGIGYERVPLSPVITHLLNDRGTVAGLIVRPGTETGTAAARYDATGVHLLGNLGGSESWSRALNNAGDVVGRATTASGLSHAFLYTDAGGMVDLDTRGMGHPFFSMATAINDHGLIGGEFTDTDGSHRAFLSDGASGLVDLNTLLNPAGAAHWMIESVADVNNLGQIVGTGRFDGQRRSFILNVISTPVPEPGTWMLMLIGLPVLRRFGRRSGSASAS